METQIKFTAGQTDLAEIYRLSFLPVARLVKRYGGGLDDAKDVFHDALVTWLELPEDKQEKISNRSAYLVTVARNEWFRRVEKMKRMREAATLIEDEEISVSNDLYNLLVSAGKKCMDLLQEFYYENRPAAAIAQRLGLSGAHSASVQKYKCIEKLRRQVKAAGRRKEDFYEN